MAKQKRKRGLRYEYENKEKQITTEAGKLTLMEKNPALYEKLASLKDKEN